MQNKKTLSSFLIVIAAVVVGYFALRNTTAVHPSGQTVSLNNLGGSDYSPNNAPGDTTGSEEGPLNIMIGYHVCEGSTANDCISQEMYDSLSGDKADLIAFSILPGQEVSGSLLVQGIVQGGYFFEGSTGVYVMDSNKNVLRTTHITATTDWMTAGPVTFTGTLDFTGLPKGPGYVSIKSVSGEDNALNVKQIFIPIVIQ